MSTILTATAAAVLIAVSEADAVTLTEVARAAQLPVSTAQRAVEGLVDAGAVERERPRGRLRLAPSAPVRALREIAAWQLGKEEAAAIGKRLRGGRADGDLLPPATIRNPEIRAAWPQVIHGIVERADPVRIILFGSQARGDARPDSDLDLLVVVEQPTDKRELRVLLGQAFSTARFGKDILVASTTEAASPLPGSVIMDAIRDGVVVYER